MTPYYDEGGITIYHADCADVLPTIDPADVNLVLTDPPYGISYRSNNVGYIKLRTKGERHQRTRPVGATVENDDQPFDPTPLLSAGTHCVLFGAQHFLTKLPDGGGLIVWDKTGDKIKPPGRMSEAEIAWTDLFSSVRLYKELWFGGMRDFAAPDAKLWVHPTQKPVRLMKWILDRWTEPGDLILDPYMGSGPVAQACHEMGRRYVGAEIVEDYCRIAVDRLRQGVLPLESVASG